MFFLFRIDVTVCRLMDRIRTACLRSEVCTALVVGGAVVWAVTVTKRWWFFRNADKCRLGYTASCHFSVLQRLRAGPRHVRSPGRVII